MTNSERPILAGNSALEPGPRLAIVTPSFNTGRYIADAVRSVLSQNAPRVDYVVMDGGSTDETIEVLQSFGSALQWVSRGSGAIRRDQQGLLDRRRGNPRLAERRRHLRPRALKVVAEYFAAHPDVALVYGDATYIDAGGRTIARCAHVEPWSPRRLRYYSDFIVQPAAFFRRSAFAAVGGLDPAAHWAMDYDLWLRLAAGGYRVAYLPRELARYRWLSENKTATGGRDRLDEIERILARHGHGVPAYVQLERCNLDAHDALVALRRGRPITAARLALAVARSIVLSPRVIASLLSPHTWRVIWVGQVLRARAAKMSKGMKAEGKDNAEP